ncbi:hypothetical protein [Ruania rhizosphaerae]|uniref:hypothetical protein n=1 Tax=Ruania rhizosphaerae TaxID=1840413 RepID=UPI001357B0F8|nr:hypothetical protein [Ruania rhizosphaerae]
MNGRSMGRVGAALGAVAVTAAALTGCSSSGGETTCTEYWEMESSDRTSTIRSMLSAHDLEPSDVGNLTGAKDNVRDFCGMGNLELNLQPPSQNHDEPIENGVDWDSPYW